MKLIFYNEIPISRKNLWTSDFFPIKIPKFDLTQTPEGNKGPPIRRTYSDDIKGRVQLLEKAMSNSKYNTNDQRLETGTIIRILRKLKIWILLTF